MSDNDRALADTYFIQPSKDKNQGGYTIEIKKSFENRKMTLPSGSTVQGVSRELFEQAVRAATLKE